MLSSSNSKNSSSDDDLLGLDLQEARKKHFLDYVENQSDSQGCGGATKKINIASQHSKATAMNTNNNISSNSINNSNNNNGTASSNNYYNNAQQSIDSNNKKNKMSMNERGPSTSKMATTTTSSIDHHQLSSLNLPNNNNSVDAVYSILSMLGSSINSADITSKFLEFSKNREMCSAMRLSGCISLLVQIIHSEPYDAVRQKECVQALHNIISCHNDDKVGRREARVLKLNEQLFMYCDALRSILENELSDNIDRYPIQAIGVLMKISFDEDHRYAMCQLGALQTISTLIQLDHEVHGPVSTDNNCITLRRYAGMCLTNLTFGDGNNKALLCSNKKFMKALVDQINSSSDELVQV
jgi:Adenomatous polyposis coli (APC) repeat